MSFISVAVRPERRSDILLIGDITDAEGLKNNKPYSKGAEGVLENSLHMAGLTWSDVEFRNLFPNNTKLFGLYQDSKKPSKRTLLPGATTFVDEMNDYIEHTKPKVVLPMGAVATKYVLNRTDYTDIRGYPFQKPSYLVIPTVHPSQAIWSNYEWRFYIANDLQRAKDFRDGKLRVIHPSLNVITDYELAGTVLHQMWLDATPIAFDIEVSNYEVSCIGFSNKPHIAYTIPLDDRWSPEQEVSLWNMISQILESPAIPKVLQNGIFDTYFVLYKMGIFTRGLIEDTMIGHSICYPNFLKGLGFLGSIHTTYTYWKDQANWKSIKKED